MSIQITINKAVKRYGNNTVIRDLSLDIPRGCFFTLLGPSGCGKTTLLRMIAGFNTIEGGDFYFNDKCINDVEPGRRNIGMVFQNYAIFPHMTVRGNVAFGLKNRRLGKDRVAALTDEFMRLVQIDQYADRKPAQLSGGQQQRVALARALVIQPDVLLMDEPLSNLDAKLRLEMRAVIRKLQRDVAITTVYVTHDQEEAMAISDTIAVMNQGEILHTGSPEDIYQRPANLFVATFIGKSNQIEGEAALENGHFSFVMKNGYRLPLDGIRPGINPPEKLIMVARPEELYVHPGDSRVDGVRALVNDSVFLGANTHYFVTLETSEQAEIIQEAQINATVQPGSTVVLTFKTPKVNVFDAQTGQSLMSGVRNLKGGNAT